MSEDQLQALLAAIASDPSLKQRLQQATDLDAAAVIAQEAGFKVSKEEWLQHQSGLSLSDAELESVSGGDNSAGLKCCNTNNSQGIGDCDTGAKDYSPQCKGGQR